MSIIFCLLLALALTTLLVPPLAKLAPRLDLLDMPGARHAHDEPTPTVGGIAMLVGTTVAVWVWLPLDPLVVGFLVAIGIIGIVGVWDDRRDIDYRIKFLGQIVAIVSVVMIGDLNIFYLPFAGLRVAPAWLSVPLTVFLLLAITNAVNLSDGLDGLAGGVSLLTLGGIALFALEGSDTELLLLVAAVAGSTLGFLRYNSYPARVFMGDTGSQFLGLSVGVFTIQVTQVTNTALSPAIPLFLLGLPVLDTVMVMGQRLCEGRSPFSADRNHIHHKLMSLGLVQYESVSVIYIAQFVCVALAYAFRYHGDLMITTFYAVLIAVSLSAYHLIRTRTQERSPVLDSPSSRHRVHIRRDHALLVALPGNVLRFAVPALLVVASLLADHVPPDFGYAALVLLVLSIMTFTVRTLPFHLFERITLFIVASFVLYLFHESDVNWVLVTGLDVYVGLLVLLLGSALRFLKDTEFRVSPLDFLIVVAALAADYFRDLGSTERDLGALAVRLIVVYYACEYLVFRRPRTWDALRLSMLTALTVLAVRGLLF